MYKDKIKTFEKLTRILELIKMLQNYNLQNSNKANVWHQDRMQINKLIIIRLKSTTIII